MAKVRAALDGAAAGRDRVYLSLISLGEVLYVVERERGLIEAQQTLAVVDQLPLELLPVTRATVLAAAHVKARFPLAYADSFVVIAARDQAAVVMTGDLEFEPVAEPASSPSSGSLAADGHVNFITSRTKGGRSRPSAAAA